ncbi:MAG: glucokinase [Pseudomonadota bacterium]
MSHILAGDIGGTKTLLQIRSTAGTGAVLLQKSYPSAAYAGLAEILQQFLTEAGVTDIAAACFALAGPVLGRRVQLTNLPWAVDADELAGRFAIPRLQLVNDFAAVGHGLDALQPSDLLTLQSASAEAHGTRLVVGAGTGLGVGYLTWCNGKYMVHPSEGGHMDFAPLNAMQEDLLHHLQAQHGHVSYERIVSGPGLVALLEFVCATGRAGMTPQLSGAMRAGDAAAAITRLGQQSDEPAAAMALGLFMEIYGAFVGNFALATLPRGGVFVAGGIAAKIAEHMTRGPFLNAFCNKGRFADLLGTLPLQLVLNPGVGLLGADVLASSDLV